MSGDATKQLTDTNEKILMKDHDILIALHTQNGEMIRRMDNLTSQLAENQKSTYAEFKDIAVSQAGVIRDIGALQKDVNEMDSRIDALETKNIRMDLIAYVLASIAGVVAWFK